MQNFIKKIVKVLFGLALYSVGLLLNIHANIGLGPWEAFGTGINKLTGVSYGNVTIITGIVILIAIVGIFKEKIGFATILNTILIGMFADLFEKFNIIPYMSTFGTGLLMLFFAQIAISLASYFYISAALGCGPRDSLMVALGKKFPTIPIGVIRGSIEGTVLFIGWILGAKVGLGTVVYVFTIGFVLQNTFKLLHFDVKSVVHESVLDTMKIFKEMHAVKS